MDGQSRDGEVLRHLLFAVEIGVQKSTTPLHYSSCCRSFSRRRAVPRPHSERSAPPRKLLCELPENRHDRPYRLLMIVKDRYGSSESQVPANLRYFLKPSTI